MRTNQRPRSRCVAGLNLGPGWPAFLVLGLAVVAVRAAGPEPEPKEMASRDRFFEQKVRPLLAENCFSCHGPDKQKGGLRLDSLAAILRGGEDGPAVVPGKPGESLLVEAVNYEGLEMPPKGKLDPEKVAILTRWVEQGAHWPARDPGAHAPAKAAATTAVKSGITADDRAFWSFQPIRSAAKAPSRLPGADINKAHGSWSNWPRNRIDEFILKALREKSLTPAPEADRRTLIRRATFDLTGLPPTPDEIEAFVTDPAPDAYERLIDHLLASPRYGQHWARHWLDVVRYAESDGYNQDAFRPQAWRFRDYVVKAFNTDKPYDRFLTEQLAGDELDPDDPELRVASGYLRLGSYEYNQRNVRGQWADILNDITDITGEAFLGLSIGCARCHDHKFDPILQKDYFRLQAFFTPLLPRNDLAAATKKECADYQGRRSAWEKATAEIRRQIAAIEQPYREKAAQGAVEKFQPDIKAILAKPEQDRSPLEKQLGALAYRQVILEYEREPAGIKGPDKARRDELRRQLKTFESLEPKTLPPVMTATDVGPVAPPTVIPGSRKAEPIEPGFLTVLDPKPATIDRLPNAPDSTGRRMALARWLSRPDNPLSTRVIVNRVWQYHFGRGLVGTSNDFGRLGEKPSHPELLDWLAKRLVDEGWRLKPLHRLIMTSAAYRQAAERDRREVERARAIDPEARLLWKRTVQRLDAEEIRDAMLAVSGELADEIGGPSADANQPRRAIDTKVIRNKRDPFLDVFDAPDGFTSTGRRNTTTTANQALLLINGEWSLARARAFADRLTAERPSDEVRGQVALAYRLAFGREPEPGELSEAASFLSAQDGGVGREALVDFCHALLNANEFLYVD